MADQTGDMHAAGLEVDDEPDDVADEAAEREDLDGEEVGRRGHAKVRLEEGLHGIVLPPLGAGSKPYSRRPRHPSAGFCRVEHHRRTTLGP